MGHISLSYDELEEYAKIETFVGESQSCNTVMEKTQSETLAGRFLDETVNFPTLMKILKDSSLQSVKIRALSLVPLIIRNNNISPALTQDFNPETSIEIIDPFLPICSVKFYSFISTVIGNSPDPTMIKCIDILLMNISKNCTSSSATFLSLKPLFPSVLLLTTNGKIKKFIQELLKPINSSQ